MVIITIYVSFGVSHFLNYSSSNKHTSYSIWKIIGRATDYTTGLPPTPTYLGSAIGVGSGASLQPLQIVGATDSRAGFASDPGGSTFSCT